MLFCEFTNEISNWGLFCWGAQGLAWRWLLSDSHRFGRVIPFLCILVNDGILLNSPSLHLRSCWKPEMSACSRDKRKTAVFASRKIRSVAAHDFGHLIFFWALVCTTFSVTSSSCASICKRQHQNRGDVNIPFAVSQRVMIYDVDRSDYECWTTCVTRKERTAIISVTFFLSGILWWD